MSDLDYVKSVLYSRSIDTSTVKPYTTLRVNKRGTKTRCSRSH